MSDLETFLIVIKCVMACILMVYICEMMLLFTTLLGDLILVSFNTLNSTYLLFMEWLLKPSTKIVYKSVYKFPELKSDTSNYDEYKIIDGVTTDESEV